MTTPDRFDEMADEIALAYGEARYDRLRRDIATALRSMVPPAGHVLDDTGVVRKGTLTLTADGCVAEYGRTYWCWSHIPIFDGSGPGASDWYMGVVEKRLESTEPSEEYEGDWTTDPLSCFGTREAAEAAAKGEQKGGGT